MEGCFRPISLLPSFFVLLIYKFLSPGTLLGHVRGLLPTPPPPPPPPPPHPPPPPPPPLIPFVCCVFPLQSSPRCFQEYVKLDVSPLRQLSLLLSSLSPLSLTTLAITGSIYWPCMSYGALVHGRTHKPPSSVLEQGLSCPPCVKSF